MKQNKLRWGILGAANIAQKNWKAIHNSGNSIVVAVASREVERSQNFISECFSHVPMDQPPKAMQGYQTLLDSPEVDAVYIPLPTGLRKEWVLRAAAAGKHVLCEKPCSVTVADLQEMLEVCRRHRVQFMDGVMFMHSQRLAKVREALEKKSDLGELRRITSAFTYFGGEEFLAQNIRGDSQLEPHGCVGDLGWYCIRFALWVMNWQLPREVTGRILSEVKGVPIDFSGELLFDGGVSASFYCSFITDNQEWVQVSGTAGHLTIEDFVLPFAGSELAFETHRNVFSKQGCDFKMECQARRVTVPEPSHGDAYAQESNMFRQFAEHALAGKPDQSWPDMALKTQQALCAALESGRNGSRPVRLV